MKQRFTMRNSAGSGTQAVDRALAVLVALGDARPAPGLSALSLELGLHKTTVSRMLGALERSGFVERDVEHHGYRLGPTLLRLGVQAKRSTGLYEAARPTLVELAAATGETASLEVLVADEVLILDEAHGHFLIGSRSEIGTRWPAHATSTGKVLLAAARFETIGEPRATAHAPRARLARITPYTITTRAAFERELAKVSDAGYAIAREELAPGVLAIGAPVRNGEGRVVAAISVTGPLSRLTATRISGLATTLRQAAERVSARMGEPHAS
jgi:DNA-binding IclR family transcriptional regulator